jgi:hypothetical protein
MKAVVIAIGVGFGVFGCTLVASAQYGGYGGFGGYEDAHSSTLEEGVLRGSADFIRSLGLGIAAAGQGAVSFEEANRQAAENRAKWIQTYYDARRLNKEYQEAVRRMPDSDSVRRYLEAQRPKRFTWYELGVAGDLHWPAHLMSPKFASHREQIEKLFSERAYRGILSSQEQALIDELADEMIEELKEDIDDLRPRDYVKAKQFLVSLKHEARLPVS